MPTGKVKWVSNSKGYGFIGDYFKNFSIFIWRIL